MANEAGPEKVAMEITGPQDALGVRPVVSNIVS
jgi:hypothetical protein